ncbi:PREDICTED: late histone H2B.L4-like [Galeopterus variegatus]|uniref:Late histone H2B.L4-like n=1 Tax=Galeopterus variegatus TaxID=482537 RepID=A0ABM0PZM6_GALVR|nr:PREDICTED: late histone H2B.L4-like [Galeopterus variegatus]
MAEPASVPSPSPDEGVSTQPPEKGAPTALKQKKPGRHRRRSRRSRRHTRCRQGHRGKDSFAIYFPRVLKLVHDGLSLSQQAVNVMDSCVSDLFERLAEEAGRLARYNQRCTLTSQDIQAAVHLLLTGELRKQAVAEGTRAVLRFTMST